MNYYVTRQEVLWTEERVGQGVFALWEVGGRLQY